MCDIAFHGILFSFFLLKAKTVHINWSSEHGHHMSSIISIPVKILSVELQVLVTP